jgi:RHS repeat-associated protein
MIRSYDLVRCMTVLAVLVTTTLSARPGLAQPTWLSPITPATPNGFPQFGGDGSQSSAYDVAHDRLIVFGGVSPSDNTALSHDTWVLVNASGAGGTPTWTQLQTTNDPPGRLRHSAVYDPGTNRMIIFGGTTADGGGAFLNDVWILTNANGLNGSSSPWIQRAASGGPPDARSQQGAIYDQGRNAMAIFFGSDPAGTRTWSDVWVLQNANDITNQPTWQIVSQSGDVPSGRGHFATGYDPASHRVTIFGGCCGYSNATFVGVLDLLTPSVIWTGLSPGGTTPPPGDVSTFGYDSGSNSLIVLDIVPGDGTNGTWLLSDANATGGVPAWSNIIPGSTAGVPPSSFLVGSGYNPSSKLLIDALNVVQNGNQVPQVWILKDADASIAPPSPSIGNTGNTNQQTFFAEPVSTGNGNYFYQHTDFVIPGRGVSLLFQRAYNTLDNYSGPLGTNWTHNYNLVLTITATMATIKWGDGHGEAFTLSGTTYKPQAGVFSTLVQNQDGSFTLTQKNQTRYNFSSAGKPISIQDKNGNTATLVYDSSGNLIQVTDPAGRHLSFSYDASNRITQVTDPAGRTVSFQYDANNNLTQATDPAGGNTTFAYDANHRVTTITQPNGQTLLHNTYDSSGRVSSQTNGRKFTTTFAYDTPSTGQTMISDARGNSTVHTYDGSLRIVGITDALGGKISYAYDANNDRISTTNQNGNTTVFTYDSQGNVTGITDPLGNSSNFSYDGQNNLTSATNPKGRTTLFSYDANGNLTLIKDAAGNVTTFASDASGQLTSKTDARGNATTFSHDSSGNLTRITDALSHSTTMAYDSVGRLTSITDPSGHTATATYDALSRLLRLADPLGDQTQFGYDAVGNLLRITDANGHATNYGYDAASNLVTATDALGHVTRYSYDGNNNRVGFINAKGNITKYAFDALNRLTQITDPLAFITAYAYDRIGNVTSIIDAKGQTNRFTSDAMNRLVGIAYADGKTVSYAYDTDGNRTSMADSHGTTTYAYDVLDHLINVTHPGGKVVGYAYDAVGNRSSLMYPDGKVASYSFDGANRPVQVADWLGRSTAYTYDSAGNLTRTSYPSGANISLTYDAANRLTGVRNAAPAGTPFLNLAYTLDAVGNRTALSVNGVVFTQFTYDALNELVGAQLGTGKSTWSYDAVGNRVQQTLPVVGTTIYTYDTDDRLLQAGSATFTYDANGNQTSVARTATSVPVNYGYDAANRLVSATGGFINSAFAYDGDGSRIAQATSAGTYQYINDVATALPVVLNEQGPDGTITYGYGLGLIEEFSSKFNYFYHYDGLGSVIGLTDATGKPQAAYAYDPWGNILLSIPDSIGTKNKFRFTGEALDPGTQVYYLRARYYDPSVGRFGSRDPLPGFVKRPITLDRYPYALNNPILLFDPSGRSSLDTSGSISLVQLESSLLREGLKELGQDILGPLVRITGVELSQYSDVVTPAAAGKLAAWVPLLGPLLSIRTSYSDALQHPERSLLEDLQRGSIDLAVSTTLSLGSLRVPRLAAFGSVEYGVFRVQIQNQILEHFSGWLSDIFATRTSPLCAGQC